MKKLTRDEMKKVMGGDEEVEGGDVRTGYCIGGVGCWHYTSPVSYSVCSADILTYCGSGHGGCTSVGSFCP